MKKNRRKLRFERLEEKNLLAGPADGVGFGHTDVNLDNQTTANDALIAINHIGATQAEIRENPNLDVTGDGQVTALDALNVINEMHRQRHTNYRRTFTIQLGKTDTYGLSHNEIQWAIRVAQTEYEKIANVRLKIVPWGQGQYTLASKEIYVPQLGFGVHARGLANGIPGNKMWFHDGHISAGHSRNRPDAFDWVAFGSKEALVGVIMHEEGHAVFGYGHSSDTNANMHINAPRYFSQGEINRLVSQYGRSSRMN